MVTEEDIQKSLDKPKKWKEPKQSAQSLVDESEKRGLQERYKENARINKIEAKARANMKAEKLAELRQQKRQIMKGVTKTLSPLKKVVGAGKKATRKYKKTAHWYKTRVDPQGGYRNPQEFEGFDSDGTERPDVRNFGGRRFHLGGVSGYDRNITGVGTHERLEVGFKSPLESKGGQFEGSSKLLQMSNNQSRILDLSQKKDNKKRNIKWF